MIFFLSDTLEFDIFAGVLRQKRKQNANATNMFSSIHISDLEWWNLPIVWECAKKPPSFSRLRKEHIANPRPAQQHRLGGADETRRIRERALTDAQENY